MPEDTLRDTLSKSMDKVEAAPTSEVAVPAVEAGPTKEEVKTEPVESVKEEVKIESAKPTKEEVKAEPAVSAKEERAKPEEPKKGIRPPESWRPAIRTEHWAKLPVAVQSEIHRRERQIDEGLQAAAEARRGMEQVSSLFAQYKDVFEFEKMPPLQTVASLLNISKALRFSPGPQKAQLMAQVIQGFNVDLKALDQALSMLVPPSDPAARAVQDQNQLIQQAIQREMAPMRELMSGFQAQRQQAQQTEQQTMQSEISAFAEDPKNEYFPVVKEVMADILEAGAARGQKISLQEAYKRAILANNDLAGEYSTHQLAEATQRASASAASAASLASMSALGTPSLAGAVTASEGNLRADLERAVARHSGRS